MTTHLITWNDTNSNDPDEELRAETVNQRYGLRLCEALARSEYAANVVLTDVEKNIAYDFGPDGVIQIARDAKTGEIYHDTKAAAERARRGPHWQGGVHINSGPSEE
jgi:hypothetical protein